MCGEEIEGRVHRKFCLLKTRHSIRIDGKIISLERYRREKGCDRICKYHKIVFLSALADKSSVESVVDKLNTRNVDLKIRMKRKKWN